MHGLRSNQQPDSGKIQAPAEIFNTNDLNSAQYQAVTHGQGPVLVIAGAGTGKTRTLVFRMAWLIGQGVHPEAILLLTFTRRAAQEMVSRAATLTGSSCHRIMGGTFHATANLLLRQYGHHLGIGPNFSIIDRGDAEGIINLIRSSLGLTGKGKRFPSKRVIMNLLSGAVNKSRTIEELVQHHYFHLSEFLDDFYTIRDHYQQFKQDHGLMDYDDLLIYWQRLLQESPEARAAVCNRFQHILVDEYQDTNLIQAAIVRQLASEHSNVMVVGDDAQSIYSFRGADFDNIHRFPEQFPHTRVITLEENYRSTQPILDLTNAIIAGAQKKFAKTLFTSLEGGDRPQVFCGPNEGTEARFIADRIEKLLQDGQAGIDEIAVLFRSGFHSYKLEMELTRRNLDFEKRGGLKLTESAHIKDVLSFLRVLVNPWDNLSWNRILLHLDKVGPKTAQKIIKAIGSSDHPLKALGSYRAAPAWKEGLTRLAELFSRLDGADLSPVQLFDQIMGYYTSLFEKLYYDDYPKRKKELDQLRILISTYDDLQAFLDDTTLDPPESNLAGPEQIVGERLVLSTIHSAKGLEWDTVFVMGLAEGRFPSQQGAMDDQMEEERRLLYVAATRARKRLFLTYPQELVGADRKRHFAMMSPFLREINPGLYHRIDRRPVAGALSGSTPGKPAPRQQSARQTFTPDMRVRHAFFGIGRISAILGPRRVEVHFDRHGSKILHLDYARLEICDKC